jgi:hypothetical protein
LQKAKFYILALALLALAAGGAFWLGWGEGRLKFANECINIGNFTVWDYSQDLRRRFKCTEVLEEVENQVSAPSI